MMFTTMTRLALMPQRRQLTETTGICLIAPLSVNRPRADGRLPYHRGWHALSPTVDSGAREWHVAEGDSFIAGDALAKIDTDRRRWILKAQDDGFVAKILIQADNGEVFIPVGTPMFITVEEAFWRL
jgi:hypothetical protein